VAIADANPSPSMTDGLSMPAGPARSLLVLGAGIAGLSAADRLSKAGYAVTVLESSDRCGGTHQSFQIGPYTFDVGSIFYEAKAAIFQLAEDLKEKCPTVLRRQRRIAPSGEPMHYPVEPRELLHNAPLKLVSGLADMLASRLLVRTDGSLEAISRKRLGGRFFNETGLRAYITRFHHVPPGKLDEVFFYRRMAFIEKATRMMPMIRTGLRSVFSRKTVNAHIRRALHIRPYEGFDALFVPIRERLEAQGVRFVFGETVQKVERNDDAFAVRTATGEYAAEAVVSTIPLDMLHRILFGKPSGLVSLDMTTLFVSAASLDQRLGNVLFNFHPDGMWKRATIYSRLYPDAPTTREFFAVEVTIPEGGTHEPERAFADFSAHLTRLGLADDLRLEGNVHLKDAYPLYAPGALGVVEAALARVAETGVLAVGRQGRFEYLPTSSGVIRRVSEELMSAGLMATEPAQAVAGA
jgi:protoporphyrinogen oxidase